MPKSHNKTYNTYEVCTSAQPFGIVCFMCLNSSQYMYINKVISASFKKKLGFLEIYFRKTPPPPVTNKSFKKVISFIRPVFEYVSVVWGEF